MRSRRLAAASLLVAPALLGACGLVYSYDGYGDAPRAGAGGASTTSTGHAGSGGAAGGAGGIGPDAGPDAHLDAAPDAEPDAVADAEADADAPYRDPAADGPYSSQDLAELTPYVDGGPPAFVGGAVPSAGPASGPYPVSLFLYPPEIAAADVAAYARRLATFGYVALTVQVDAAGDVGALVSTLSSVVDWAGAAPALAGQADVGRVGAAGYSAGGELAMLLAASDSRVKAVVGIDPVQVGKLPAPSGFAGALHVPLVAIGETLDVESGPLGKAPCAPVGQSFQAFYAAASSSPAAVAVEVLGANHFSFVDGGHCDVIVACGCLTHPAALPRGVVMGLASTFLVAAHERWVRGDARYDRDLGGAGAEARYVLTGLAKLQSK
jgi:hypothetical protein